MKRANRLLIFLVLSVCINTAWSQSTVLGSIDFYGNTSLKIDIRKCLTFKEGDTLKFLTDSSAYVSTLTPIHDCLMASPGVQQADIFIVCCVKDNKWVAYFGVSDKPVIVKNNVKTKDLKLAPEIERAYDSLGNMLLLAIQSGEGGEDNSQGHQLSNHIPSRKIEEQFISYAETDFQMLRDVLKYSKYREQRIVAAKVIAYYHDKKEIVNDLLAAVSDDDRDVRNNATRALAIIIAYAQERPDLHIVISPDPFIALINSVFWTDRNKGAFALVSLTGKRDPAVLLKLKNEALESLVDMASWKNAGHAMFACMILGRMAGWTDGEISDSTYKNRQEMLAKILTAIKGK